MLDGYVSVASAKRDYGVILNADGDDIDTKATEELRRNMARPQAMFHRHVHYNANDDRHDALKPDRQAPFCLHVQKAVGHSSPSSSSSL